MLGNLKRRRQVHADSAGGGESRNSDVARRRALMLSALALPLLLGAYVLTLWASTPRATGNELRIDLFTSLARQGQIADATILDADDRIVGAYAEGRYTVAFGSDTMYSRLLDVLDEASIPTRVDQQPLKSLLMPITYMLPAFIMIDGMLLVFLIFGKSGEAMLRFGRSGARRVASDDKKTTFADLAGVDEAIEELAEVRDYLATPERFTALGATVPKGILLTGPPGCGKTLLARALAGEADVPFFSMSGSEFVEMFVGVGASRIRDFFRVAKTAAPCIAFIDELDALGRARSDHALGGQDEREAALNQLLVEMDGFAADSGVVVLGATNRPDILDPALLRPGRFDRRVAVDRPDLRGRAAILALHARGKPLAPDVDLELVARRTAGFSGADLANVVNEAALLAARGGKTLIAPRQLSEAVERTVAGPERRSRVLSADDRHRIAHHEAGHAIVSTALSGTEAVTKVSIVARGHAGGFTWLIADGDQVMLTKAQLLDRLAAMLAGRAGEELATGDVSTGAATDLEAAVGLARRMVTELGMSSTLGPFSAGASAMPGAGPGHSEQMAGRIDAEVEALLHSADQRARDVLQRYRHVLEAVALALMEDETLEGAQLQLLLSSLEERIISSSPDPDQVRAAPN